MTTLTIPVVLNDPISGRYCASFRVPDDCISNEFHLYIQTRIIPQALSCDLEILSRIDDGTMNFSWDYKKFIKGEGAKIERDFTMSYCKGTTVVVAARRNIFEKIVIAYESLTESLTI